MDAPGGSPSPRGHSRKQLRPHKGHPFAATLPSLLRQRRQPLRPLSQARKSVTHASCGSRLAAPVRRPPYVLRLQTVPLTTLLQPVPAGGSHVSIPPLPPPAPSPRRRQPRSADAFSPDRPFADCMPIRSPHTPPRQSLHRPPPHPSTPRPTLHCHGRPVAPTLPCRGRVGVATCGRECERVSW